MTAPFKSKAPSAYAEAIRNEFVSRRLANPVDGLAWGQFLEHVAANGQAGLYGSSSAAIVLKAFGRDLDADASRAHQELVDVWNQRNADVAVADRLKQNPRLIWLFLALSVERSIVNNVAQSVSVEIFAR